MKNSTIGGAPALAIILGVVVLCVFSCSGNEKPVDNAAVATPAQRAAPFGSAQKGELILDSSRGVQTTRYAIVCSQGILLSAMVSRSARNPLGSVYDAFTAIWNRSEKVKEAGLTVDAEVVTRLSSSCGFDFRALDQALQKLVTFSGDKKTITSEQARLLIKGEQEGVIWDFCDAILKGQPQVALEELEQLLRQGNMNQSIQQMI